MCVSYNLIFKFSYLGVENKLTTYDNNKKILIIFDK